MVQTHFSTLSQRVRWISELVAHEERYGVVSQMSQDMAVSRQTSYSWKAKGQRALEATFAPKQPHSPMRASGEVQRAVLTLLIVGHASYRGIQACLKELLGREVSLQRRAQRLSRICLFFFKKSVAIIVRLMRVG
jgi:hypothetical protein